MALAVCLFGMGSGLVWTSVSNASESDGSFQVRCRRRPSSPCRLRARAARARRSMAAELGRQQFVSGPGGTRWTARLAGPPPRRLRLRRDGPADTTNGSAPDAPTECGRAEISRGVEGCRVNAAQRMLGLVGILRAGASLRLTRRYPVRARGVRAGLDLWAADRAVDCVIIGDQGSPSRAVAAYQDLMPRGSRSCWAPRAAGRCGGWPRWSADRGGCCGTTTAQPMTSRSRGWPP